MAKVNLDRMSHADLLALQRDVTVALGKRRNEELAELRRKMSELANASGFELNELIGARKSSKNGHTVPVKYRNPKNPQQTWAGRGRKPTWMVEALKKGQKMESFAV